MNPKIQIIAASAIACLTSGCVVTFPVYNEPVVYRAPVAVVSGPDESILPNVIIVEGGVRHDRYYYQRHPEYYRRDMMRYPDRFRPVPPPYRGSNYRGPVYHGPGPAPVYYGGPAMPPPHAAGRPYGPGGPGMPPPNAAGRPSGPGAPDAQHSKKDDSKSKKKHNDKDRDNDRNR